MEFRGAVPQVILCFSPRAVTPTPGGVGLTTLLAEAAGSLDVGKLRAVVLLSAFAMQVITRLEHGLEQY